MSGGEAKEARHKYYLEHREELIAKAKAQIEANRERHKGYGRLYYHRHREERLAYYYQNRKERLAYAKLQGRRNIKHNGKVILRNVDKPPKPMLCELCRRKSWLQFHHWEDSKPEVGLWICNPCHITIHRLIKIGLLKANVESQNIIRSQLIV